MIIELVSDRSASTLCPIIQKYVCRGNGRGNYRTRIISDKWRGYIPLKTVEYGYFHRRINHQIGFGVGDFNSSHIEGAWSEIK